MDDVSNDMTKVLSVDINAPIDKVWREITKTGEVCRPMFDCALQVKGDALVPGARMHYTNKSGKNTFIVGEVLEVEPPRRFVHTFRFTMQDDHPSTVTWELEPRGEHATRVTIVHVFTKKTKATDMVGKGWTQILALFKSQLEDGDIPLKTKAQYAMMGAMSFMLPKRSRTEQAALLEVR